MLGLLVPFKESKKAFNKNKKNHNNFIKEEKQSTVNVPIPVVTREGKQLN